MQNLLKSVTLLSIKITSEFPKADSNFFFPKKNLICFTFWLPILKKVFKERDSGEKVWGNDVIVGKRTIDVHIRRLREKLGINTIQTLKGIGYKLIV